MANPVAQQSADPLPAQSHKKAPIQVPQCQPNVSQTGYDQYSTARDSATQPSQSSTTLPLPAPRYPQVLPPWRFAQEVTQQSADSLPAQSHKKAPTQVPQCQPNVSQTGYDQYSTARDSATQPSQSSTTLPLPAPRYPQILPPWRFAQEVTQQSADSLPAQSHKKAPTQVPQYQPNVSQTGYDQYSTARDSAIPQPSQSSTTLTLPAPQYLQVPPLGTFTQNITRQLSHQPTRASPAKSQPVPSSPPSLKQQKIRLDTNIMLTYKQLQKHRDLHKQWPIYNIDSVTSKDDNLQKQLQILYNQKAELEVRADEQEKQDINRERLNLRKEVTEQEKELVILRKRVFEQEKELVILRQGGDLREAKRRCIRTP